MQDLPPLIPADLKAARAMLGLSQRAMAEAMGTPRRTYEDWESGKNTAPPMIRLAISALYHGLKPWNPQREEAEQAEQERQDRFMDKFFAATQRPL